MRLRIVVMSALFCLLGACAQTPEQPVAPTGSGAQLFQSLCASCHGVRARGDGPIAPLIKTGVPDLTRLAHRNGGTFPTDHVRRTIDGGFDRPAHGARDMPVWGWRLYGAIDPADTAGRERTEAAIDRLVGYLQSVQR
jgi:mono/diheme cytochrome c family protein